MENTTMKKYCDKCETETDRGSRGQCKPCHRATGARWRAENIERAREIERKYRGKKKPRKPLSQDRMREKTWRQRGIRNAAGSFFKMPDYNVMLESQRGLCALCGDPLDLSGRGKGKTPHVDHDHNSGVARGLLHTTCNTGIGCLRDNPLKAVRAANYLLDGALFSNPEGLREWLEGMEWGNE